MAYSDDMSRDFMAERLRDITTELERIKAKDMDEATMRHRLSLARVRLNTMASQLRSMTLRDLGGNRAKQNARLLADVHDAQRQAGQLERKLDIDSGLVNWPED